MIKLIIMHSNNSAHRLKVTHKTRAKMEQRKSYSWIKETLIGKKGQRRQKHRQTTKFNLAINIA